MSRLLRLMFVVLLVLAACDDDDNGNGDESIELPQTITAQDDMLNASLTVRYPTGWSAERRGGTIVLANDADVLNIVSSAVAEATETVDATADATAGSASITAGQVYIDFMVLPRELLESNMGLDPDATAVDLLRLLFMQEGSNRTFSDIRVISLDGRDAVSVTATQDDAIQPGRVQFYVTAHDGGFAAISAFMAEGEESFDPIIRAIAEAVIATFETE